MLKTLTLCAAAAFTLASCNNQETKPIEETTSADSTTLNAEMKIKEEKVSYTGDGVTMNGFAAYPENKTGLPAVIVIHEWWGQTEYPRRRARELAALGYYAFALDMYGGGQTADSPQDAQKLSGPFYGTMKVAQPRFEAALNKVKAMANVDTARIAAIGYCFGGAMAINMARAGEPLKAVVSFHGDLMGNQPGPDFKSAILVLHGEAE